MARPVILILLTPVPPDRCPFLIGNLVRGMNYLKFDWFAPKMGLQFALEGHLGQIMYI